MKFRTSLEIKKQDKLCQNNAKEAVERWRETKSCRLPSAAFLLSADRREILITNSYIRIMLWLRHKNIKARNGDQVPERGWTRPVAEQVLQRTWGCFGLVLCKIHQVFLWKRENEWKLGVRHQWWCTSELCAVPARVEQHLCSLGTARPSSTSTQCFLAFMGLWLNPGIIVT